MEAEAVMITLPLLAVVRAFFVFNNFPFSKVVIMIMISLYVRGITSCGEEPSPKLLSALFLLSGLRLCCLSPVLRVAPLMFFSSSNPLQLLKSHHTLPVQNLIADR